MEAQIKNIKQQMNDYEKTFFSTEVDQTRIERFTSLKSMLFILKKTVINHENRETVIKEYENIIATLKGIFPRTMLDTYLEKAEHQFVDSIMSGQGMMKSKFDDAFNWARQNTYCVGNILSYFLYYKLYSDVTENISFKTFLDAYFCQILKIFNIEPTIFIKQLAKKYICGQCTPPDEDIPIVKEYIIYLFQVFFSDPLNFKFIYRANSIYIMFSSQQNAYSQIFNIQIACTTINKNCQYTEDLVNIGKVYKATNAGIDGIKLRCDNFITFGKSPLADIVFPKEDTTVDLLSFALFFNGEKWLIIDCSKKSNTKIKLVPYQNYLIKPGTLINIAHLTNIWIKNIVIIDFDCDEYFDENDIIHSELEFEYIDGPYDYGFGNRTKVVSTRDKKNKGIKTEFIFGRAGPGKQIDFCGELDGYAEDEHMKLSYLNGSKWVAVDLNSNNGTFIQLKNYDQFIGRNVSKAMPLFFGNNDILDTENEIYLNAMRNEPASYDCCISISHYSFYISKVD
ncbi:hypothetical protein SteCoe_2873 [Stentor coeruleus]|uniref:FHA domain-containing protein n=1 Tax=Stentor coeruleus TaxID=5963 RepID=A0A1R2CYN1_9CILI|nr:hypothetical protein SteCoe_2873 [Stentor coeruleus]